MKMLLPSIVSLVLATACTHAVRTPSSGEPPLITPAYLARSLSPGHPRIFVREGDFALLKKELEERPTLQQWYKTLEKNAEVALSEPVVKYILMGKGGLLDQSRKALETVTLLAGLYRLDGDARKLARAKEELLAAVHLPDWDPNPNFLNTAEMAFGVAIGYDWLFDELTPYERKQIRNAIVKMGLDPGLEAYRAPAWWTIAHSNWNPVCNGGLTVAALAIADEEPGIAAEIIENARRSFPAGMEKYSQDGGDPEGPMYWRYGARYGTYYLAATKSALGTDFGYAQLPGFSKTGFFRIHVMGPLDKAFNFSDSNEYRGTAPQMIWMAREFQEPAYWEYESRVASLGRATIFHLLWALHSPSFPEAPELPQNVVFKNINTAFFRSSWNNDQALYVGFKGGDNNAGHSHLDLGSFVLDVLGHRWAVDLGPDDYDLPGYFDKNKTRWTYFRMQTQSHNTFVIDDQNQDHMAKAEIIRFEDRKERAFAVMDLTEAYHLQLKSARRGLMTLGKDRVVVQDELEADHPATLKWNFFTPAKISLKGNEALLAQGESQLKLRILSPRGAVFQVRPAHASPPQIQQPEIQNLQIQVHLPPGRSRLTVLMDSRNGGGAEPIVEPLSEWN